MSHWKKGDAIGIVSAHYTNYLRLIFQELDFILVCFILTDMLLDKE